MEEKDINQTQKPSEEFTRDPDFGPGASYPMPPHTPKKKHPVSILNVISLIACGIVVLMFFYFMSMTGKFFEWKNQQEEGDTIPDPGYQTQPADDASDSSESSLSLPDKKENETSSIENISDKEKETTEASTETMQPNNLISYLNSDYETYQKGFYLSKISQKLSERMDGVSFHQNNNISYDELRYLIVSYYDFNGEVQTGELVCNKEIARDLMEIFFELYQNQYQIEKMKLIDDYGADDDLSCADNNTSCFNYREVAGSKNLSKHAFGMAIDINPFYNPYVTYPDGVEHISPQGSEKYADRSGNDPHMIKEGDLCYNLFIGHGFTWGGKWKTLKDYQHFQKEL